MDGGVEKPQPHVYSFLALGRVKGLPNRAETEPHSMQVLLQVAQEGREEGTSGRSSGGRGRPGSAPVPGKLHFLPWGVRALPSRRGSTGTPSPRPARPASRRSALTTAPRCLPRGRGCLHLPAPAPTRPRPHRRGSGASLPAPAPRLRSPRGPHHRAWKPALLLRVRPVS